MLNVISFSLWGDNPKYTIGAIRNAHLANSIYSGWMCYFFIDKTVPDHIITELKTINNTKIIYNDIIGDWKSMFWRFKTSYDPAIQRSIFRDTDSRLSLREKHAVDEWVNSDKTFHIMRDHPYHKFPILGGMWGMKHNPTYDIKNLLDKFDANDRYGTDYEFFIQSLYPLIGDDKIVHDPFFDKKDFPTQRNNKEFVGDVFDQYENRHSEYHKYL